MKGVVYVSKDTVEVRDLPMPITADDEIMVKIEYCALCATDVHVVSHGLYGLKPPMVMGHEATGTVVAVGAQAGMTCDIKVGDRVSACPLRFCGKCEYCKKGLVMHCKEAGFEPEKKPMDAMVEYRTYYPEQLFKLPDYVTFEQAALVEPISTATRGINLANMKIGSTVCISGAGSIGLIMLNLIMLQGGTRITVIDPVPEKRQMALDLGAQFVIDPTKQDVVEECMQITDGMGFDYVFEMSGSPKAAPLCPKMIGKCGAIIYFAVYPMDYSMPLNLFDMYGKEARLQFVFTDPFVFPASVDLLSRLQMDKLIGPVYDMDDAQQAFNDFQVAKYPKLLIKCAK